MIRLFRNTKPFNILHRFASIALLGNRYRPLSTYQGNQGPFKSFTRYRITTQESEEINRLLLLAKSSSFDSFLASLKSSVLISTLVFNNLLQHKFAMLPKREVEIKEQIFDIMIQRGILPDHSSFVPMISLYGKAGDLKKADEMLERMKEYVFERKTDIYNALMKCHERDVARVDYLFQEMIEDDIEPNAISFNLMINAYSKSGDLGRAVEFYSLLLEKGIKPNLFICNSMINVYSKCGDLAKALGIFEEMLGKSIKPDIYTLITINQAFAKHPNRAKAGDVFSRMEYKNAKEMSSLLREADLLAVSSSIPPHIPLKSINEYQSSVKEVTTRLLLLVNNNNFDEVLTSLKADPTIPPSVFGKILKKLRYYRLRREEVKVIENDIVDIYISARTWETSEALKKARGRMMRWNLKSIRPVSLTYLGRDF
jgi:pentatricopeptide repeat protein